MAELATPAPTKADDQAAWTRAQVVMLLAITLLATMIRLLRIEQWSWSEAEAFTWQWITAPLRSSDGLFASGDGWSPLAYLGLRGLCGLGILPSHGEGWLRLPFGFAGVLVVPLLVLVGRPLVGAGGALLAALLLAIHPLHVAVSQATEPVGVALVFVLVGIVCRQNGSRRAAWLWWLLAGACAPIAWTVVAVALAERLPVAAQQVATRALAIVVLGLLPWALGAVSIPVFVAGAFGWCLLPQLPLRALTVVPLAVALVWSLANGGERTALAIGGLAGCSLFAAGGLQRLFAAARSTLAGSPRAVLAGAALPALVVVTWLTVDAFLYFTVYRGGRSPWRRAADAVWVAANERGGFVVGAGAGVRSLTCYLRPNHWRTPAVDAHPGVAVLPLDLGEPAAAFVRLAARAEALALLVLRQDEVERLPAAAAAQLAATFELLRVVQSPQLHGDDTLYVYRCIRVH